MPHSVNFKDVFKKNLIEQPRKKTIQEPNMSPDISFKDISSNKVILDISSNKVDLDVVSKARASEKNIVIIYTYFKTGVADYNINYFLKKELTYKKNIDYIIVINGYLCGVVFPKITNLTVLRRGNKGYDFGGHSHALKFIEEQKLSYNYYFFMNSGVFGPIMPKYISSHWSDIFIAKLSGLVKIVSTSIVCLSKTDLGGYGPKAEGFFFLTDATGLKLLIAEKTVFCEHKDKVSAIINGEYGMSRCIFRHGFTIDCILKGYSGVDWFNRRNWGLNNNLHPTRKNAYFGKSINPYDVIFHKWHWAGQERVNYNVVKEYVDNTV